MNLRTCRVCGAEMALDDAFCPDCGTHVAELSGDEAALPGEPSARRRAGGAAEPAETPSAYERPYERLDTTEPPEPYELVSAATGDIDTLPANDALEEDLDAPVEGPYAEYPPSPRQGVSPMMVAAGVVFGAIIVAGIVVALAGGSDGNGSGTGIGGGLIKPSGGGFGSMLPDGTLVCNKAPATTGVAALPGARTAIAGAIEITTPPSTWTGREVAKASFQGTGPGLELALNPGDLDRPIPQSARITVLTVESNPSYFPDQFLLASLRAGNATTTKQDCVEYGQYTALRVHRIELTERTGATMATRYVAVHDKSKRGSAAFFFYEDPRDSAADAEFFESLVASTKLLK